MSSVGAAPRAAVPTSAARAEASRRNGARSRGPSSPEGKARSAQNALKHGLRAQRFVLLADEDGAGFRALEAALIAELAPAGALQAVLAQRVAIAAWRLARADRIEALLLADPRAEGDLGRALTRDGHGARVFPTLLRYRGTALAELTRCLRALKALQAEQAAAAELSAARPPRPVRPTPASPARTSPLPTPDHPAPLRKPSEPAPKRRPNELLALRRPNQPEALPPSIRPEPLPPPIRPDAVESPPQAARPHVRTNPTPLGVHGAPQAALREPVASPPGGAASLK